MTDQHTEFNGISQDDRLWAALAYAFSPLIPVIIYLMEDERQKPFVRAHLSQALMLGILYLVLVAVTLGCASVLWIGMLYLAFRAYQGELIEIPFLSEIARNQDWS